MPWAANGTAAPAATTRGIRGGAPGPGGLGPDRSGRPAATVLLPINVLVRLTDITGRNLAHILVAEVPGRPQLWQRASRCPGRSARGGPWAASDGSDLGQPSMRPRHATLPMAVCHQLHEQLGGLQLPPRRGQRRVRGRLGPFPEGQASTIRVLAALVTRAGGEVVSDCDSDVRSGRDPWVSDF